MQAEAGGGFADVLLVDGVEPVRAEGRFALLDEIGDESDHRRNFSAPELGDFLKGASLLQQFAGFLGGIGRLGMPFLGGPFTARESAEGIENFIAVEFTFLFAYTGDLAEFEDGAGLGLADGVEGGVVENDEGGDHLLAGGVSAPLAEEFAEFFVHPNGWIQFVFGGFEEAVGILDWQGFPGSVLGYTRQPPWGAAANGGSLPTVPFFD